MPHVLLYEFLTSSGFFDGDRQESESLRREGTAMLAALAADFAAIDDVQTTVILDSRQDIRRPPWTHYRIIPVHKPGGGCDALAANCGRADWTVVVAPEIDWFLESRSRIVEDSGGQLLGASSTLVALAADKQRTAEHLAAMGVPVALGVAVDAGNLLGAANMIGFPAVIKPCDGAGSTDVFLLTDRDAARLHKSFRGHCRLERFYPGLAASVAVLCGPKGLFPLPACRQRLSDDGRFRYLGGSCPLEPALDRRAKSLAIQTIRSLTGPLGYVGIDLILGDDPDGQNDVVIEINPRLTTSYVGLRAIADGNLAAAMLAAAEGRQPNLSFGDRIVEFDSDGTIHRASATAANCGARRA